MFDPQRACRVDRQRKRLSEDTKSVKRNLRTWKDEVEKDDEDYQDLDSKS